MTHSNQTHASQKRAHRKTILAGLALLLAGTTTFATPALAMQNGPQADNVVVTNGAAQWVEGNQRITPTPQIGQQYCIVDCDYRRSC